MRHGTRSTPDLGEGGLSTLIKNEALRLGFSLCGITHADPPPHHVNFRQWIGEGKAGEMLYLHRQEPKRGDLELVLPNAKSVVSVGLNYSPEDGATNEGASGQVAVISRYARFDDYHVYMWAKLDELLAFALDLVPHSNGKRYCDTGPVTERDIAMRAGIGWIGKHTNLISRKLGNWFFLGELILDYSLELDPPETPHCGTCTRCISACPTGALRGPFDLDARKCIAYLTIELKGSIPTELRPLIGTRIYGCDDCLAVCPWNKFARQSKVDVLMPRSDLQSPDLVGFLDLSEEQFKIKFANSPILRTKRRGFLRNVCVALGNVGDCQVLPRLRRFLLTEEDPLVREHASWAIDELTPKCVVN